MTGLLVPTVIERTTNGERAFDIYSRLLNQRVVFLGTEVSDSSANLIIAQLLHLEAEDPDADITLYVNSPGGSVTAMMGMIDTINYVKPDVATVCMGQAASAAAVLLSAGTKGKRYCLPNSRVLLHQPLGGAQGQASDIHIHATEILRLKQRINEMLAENSGQPLDKLELDTDRDFILNAEEAVAYGVVDEVIAERPTSLGLKPEDG